MTTLEARYRRLLRAYPRDHRRVHEEEMLGVLLAMARPGQRRPGLYDALDLLHGALLARARQPWRAPAGDWLDALAIVSLLAPIWLAMYDLFAIAAELERGVLLPAGVGEQVRQISPYVGWPIVLLLVLLGLRRPAIVTAWGACVVYPILYRDWHLPVGSELLAIVAALALTLSPGPARGRVLVGGRRLQVYVAGVLVTAVALVGAVVVRSTDEVVGSATAVGSFLGTVAVVAAAISVRTRVHLRAAVLLVVPLASEAAQFGNQLLARAGGQLPQPMGVHWYFWAPAVALGGISAFGWLAQRRRVPAGAPDRGP